MQKYRPQYSMELTSLAFCCAKEQSEIMVVMLVAIFPICRFRNKSFLGQCQQRSEQAVPQSSLSAERLRGLQPGRSAQRSPPTFQLLLVRHVALDEQRPLRFKLLVQGRLALLSRLGVAVQQGYLSGAGGK